MWRQVIYIKDVNVLCKLSHDLLNVKKSSYICRIQEVTHRCDHLFVTFVGFAAVRAKGNHNTPFLDMQSEHIKRDIGTSSPHSFFIFGLICKGSCSL